LLLIGLAGCFKTEAPDSGGDSPLWDTTLIIKGAVVSSDSILRRSWVEEGESRRLKVFLDKCSRGGEVKVGFLGGSITAGALASVDSNRYSTLLLRFLRKAYPSAVFREINAGMGATGSRFGCSRMREDLLSQGPDLVILEFAVNDDPADSLNEWAYEGLLRQWPGPTLLFQTMKQSGDSLNQAAQARLGSHYALPVISYLRAMRPWVASGLVPWSTLARDELHPNDTGHAACASDPGFAG